MIRSGGGLCRKVTLLGDARDAVTYETWDQCFRDDRCIDIIRILSISYDSLIHEYTHLPCVLHLQHLLHHSVLLVWLNQLVNDHILPAMQRPHGFNGRQTVYLDKVR